MKYECGAIVDNFFGWSFYEPENQIVTLLE
jgi:hypothetical protein